MTVDTGNERQCFRAKSDNIDKKKTEKVLRHRLRHDGADIHRHVYHPFQGVIPESRALLHWRQRESRGKGDGKKHVQKSCICTP